MIEDAVDPGTPMDEDLRARFSQARRTDDPDALRLLARLRATVRGERGEYGRYRVIGHLGRGGFGEVFEGFDPVLQRRVAIKVLSGSSRTTMLRSEARALASTRHPNVVEVFEVAEQGDDVFVAMELIDGRDLATWAAAEPRTTAEIVEVLVAVADGIGAVHGAGLVHADIKPNNVLIGRDGRVKVVDFGLAQPLGDLTVPGALGDDAGPGAGTVPYMAPELLQSAAPSVHSDVFALCATAFELLTGQRAFPQRSVMGQLEAKAARRHMPWPEGIPSRVVQLVERGLEPSPTRRFESMRELASALRQQRQRRGEKVLVAAATVPAVVLAWFISTSPERDECQTDGHAARWADAVRTAVGPTRAVEPDFAAMLAELASRADTWNDVRDDVCATPRSQVRAEMLTCLDDTRRRTDAYVAELVAGHAGIERPDRALGELRVLPRGDDCGPGGAQATARGSDPAFVAAIAAARAAATSDDLERARAEAELALALADESGAPGDRAEALRVWGNIATDRYEIQDAREALDAAFWLASSSGDDNTAALAAADLVLVVGNYQGDVDGAIEWQRHAEAALARIVDPRPIELKLLGNVLQVFNEHGRHTETVAAAERARKLAATFDDGEGPASLRATRRYLDALQGAGQLDRVFPLAEEAFARTRAVFGAEHVETDLAELTLANGYLHRGDAAKAEPHFVHVLARGTEVFGRNNPFNITVLQNLAATVSALGRDREAEALFTEALAITRESLGERHNRVAMLLLNIAATQSAQGRRDEADASLNAALVLATELEGEASLLTTMILSNLGENADARGDGAGARGLVERALASAEAAAGPAHPVTARTRARLGNILAKADRHAEAQRAYEQSLRDLEAAGVANEVAQTQVWYAQTMLALGRKREAGELSAAAVDYLRAHGPEQSLREAQTLAATIASAL